MQHLVSVLRDEQNVDGEREARRFGYPTFEAFLTSSVCDTSFRIENDANKNPCSVAVIPNELNMDNYIEQQAALRNANTKK